VQSYREYFCANVYFQTILKIQWGEGFELLTPSGQASVTVMLP